MSDALPRWLGPEQVAAYVSCRVDHVPRLVRRGLLPPPSLHLGPRSPRFDRLRIDAMFGQAAASATDTAKEMARATLRARLENRSAHAR
jgi:hypothetical protein